MKRLLPVVALLLAGSAWAASGVKTWTSWYLYSGDSGIAVASVKKDEDGVMRLSVVSKNYAQTTVALTKEEAASMGRALLDAAGEAKP